MSHPDPTKAPGLFIDSFRNFTNLMQKEVALAKAEITENISRAAVGVGFLALAAILALTALNVLAGALVAYIASTGISAGMSALIVGGVLLICVVGLVLAGKSRLTASALEPTRTMNNLQRDVTAVKEATDV